MNMLNKAVLCVAVTLGGVFVGSAIAEPNIGEMEFYNEFDPSKPTIIAAHGWFGSIDYASTFGLSPSFADTANIIGWEWDAVVFTGITRKARRSGQELAQEFVAFLDANAPEYDQPIQVVGHSLGTHVVLAAAAELRDIGRDDPNFEVYQADQITLVDTGFNDEIPVAIANIMDDYLVPLKLDNYFSPGSAGGTGQGYEGDLANTRVPLAHVALWHWYFASLDSEPMSWVWPGATYSVAGQFAEFNYGAVGIKMTEGWETPVDLTDDMYVIVYH